MLQLIIANLLFVCINGWIFTQILRERKLLRDEMIKASKESETFMDERIRNILNHSDIDIRIEGEKPKNCRLTMNALTPYGQKIREEEDKDAG